jgi:hypothetical protein
VEALGMWVAGLTVDQHLALSEEARKQPEINSKLALLANCITEVHLDLPPGVEGNDYEAMKGGPLSTGAVVRCVAYAKGSVARGNAILCRISRLPLLGGLQLTLQEISRSDKDFERKSGGISRMTASIGSFVSGSIFAEDTQASHRWLVEPDATAGKDEKNDDDHLAMIHQEAFSMMGSGEDDFWEKVGNFCGGKGPVYGYALVTISGVPLRGKISTPGGMVRPEGRVLP